MKKKYHLIFGCGYYGRSIFRKIKKKNIIFIDNNYLNKKFLGKKVFKPENIKKKNISFIRIYIAGRHIDKQLIQLNNLKLNKKIKIFKNFELRQSKTFYKKRENRIFEILNFLIKKLNQKRIIYWLDRSSLLALKRNQSFSELSDVDISIDYRHYQDFKKIMKLMPTSFIVGKKIINLSKKKINKYFIKSKNRNLKKNEPAIIDFIYRKVNNKFIYSLGIKLKKIPYEIIFPLKKRKYKKLEFLIPRKSNQYLNFIYGKKWKKKTDFYLKSKRI